MAAVAHSGLPELQVGLDRVQLVQQAVGGHLHTACTAGVQQQGQGGGRSKELAFSKRCCGSGRRHMAAHLSSHYDAQDPWSTSAPHPPVPAATPAASPPPRAPPAQQAAADSRTRRCLSDPAMCLLRLVCKERAGCWTAPTAHLWVGGRPPQGEEYLCRLLMLQPRHGQLVNPPLPAQQKPEGHPDQSDRPVHQGHDDCLHDGGHCACTPAARSTIWLLGHQKGWAACLVIQGLQRRC